MAVISSDGKRLLWNRIYKNETGVIIATGWQGAVLTYRLRDNVRLSEGKYCRKKQINKDI